MKRLSSILLFGLLLMAGCTKDFEEINTNPNSPTTLTNPGLLLPNVIRSSVNRNFDNSFSRGALVANLLASDFGSNFSNWSRSDASGYFLWNYYDYIRDLNTVIKISDEQGLMNFKGVALVLRSWMFQCLTDIYGPIPFREAAAVHLEGTTTPKYEEQAAVYAGILADLDEANGLIGTSTETLVGDILYNGELSNWKKFANALSLRILLRQSKRVDPTTAMKNIVEHPDKYPLFENNDEQAALQYMNDRPEDESPIYRGGNGATNTKVSKQLVDYFKSLDDTRLLAYAQPTPNSSEGSSADFEYAGDLNGVGTFPDANSTSGAGMIWMSIQYDPNLASPTAGQGMIISYSEQQFILAEAAERGFISGGSAVAETYYLDGIANQFTYYSSRIPDFYADSYLHLSASDIHADPSYYTQPGVAYAGSTQDKLEKIWLQKWISLYLVGYEAWSEWRRTGFPEIPIGPVGPGYIPRRMFYPADEMRINEVHYNEAVNWLGADDLQSHVWWDE